MTLRCPYDPNHIMPADSFTLHLRKCKATNKHLFAQCKYNLRHVVKKDKLQKHYKKCKDSPYYRDGSDDDVQEKSSSEWSCGEEEKPGKQIRKNKKKEQRSQQRSYEKSWLEEEKQEVVPEDLQKKVGDISMIGNKGVHDW